jgi:hypothetical protein
MLTFPAWLTALSWTCIALGVGSALVVGADILRHPQKMAVMNWVWPLTSLFGGPLWLAFYGVWGRNAGRAAERKPSPAMGVALVTNHCGAGCSLGDMIVEALMVLAPSLALAFGWRTVFHEKMFAVWVADYLVAFVLGIGFQYFTIKPMGDLSPRAALIEALKADAASITAWQVGMYGLMAAGQFLWFRPAYGGFAPASSPEFWLLMQIAMLAGFATAYPANWLLVKAGVKASM